MVSAAKLKRAQDRVVAARPFANKMMQVLGDLSAGITDDFTHPLLTTRGDERYLVVFVTADKGLAGAFNANLIKAAQAFLKEHAGKTIEMIAVGRKGRDFFRRRDMRFTGEYLTLTGKGRVDYAEAVTVARDVIKQFTEDETLDKVFLIYNEFKSVLQQRVIVDQLLPVSRTTETTDASAQDTAAATRSAGATAAVPVPDAPTDYVYEQPAAEIFARLLPRLIETQIFRAMLESVASEQGARMTAMDSASKNAGELIGALTLNMNRVRQAAITNEIIEVVSGSSVAAT